ncbi:MAG: hypothetical protein WBA68_04115 [Alteraurantiacibacter sp.]
MRATRAILPATLSALAACSAPQVEADLRPSCDPLDGPAFEILIPDGERVVTADGPGWPDAGDGHYEINAGDPMEQVTIRLCDTDLTACEAASLGSFALSPRAEGGFGGTLQAVFPEGGSRRLTFTALQDEDHDPPLCG